MSMIWRARRAAIGLTLIGVLLCSSGRAGEEQAVRDLMQATIDKTIAILRDPDLKGDAKREERRAKVRTTLLSVTDARRVSLLVLGRQRSKFSEAQIDQFTEAFSELVFSTYISNLEKYSDEKVKILSVEMRANDKAYAATKIISSKAETPADFSFFKDEKGAWKVYDLTVEGVSIVGNYRTQFSELMLKMTPDELIAHLKQKAKENEAAG